MKPEYVGLLIWLAIFALMIYIGYIFRGPTEEQQEQSYQEYLEHEQQLIRDDQDNERKMWLEERKNLN